MKLRALWTLSLAGLLLALLHGYSTPEMEIV